MALSLLSTLLFVALMHAMPHVARSAFENKGGQDLSVCGGQEMAKNLPPSCDCPDVRVDLGQCRSGVYWFPWPSQIWIRSRQASENYRCACMSRLTTPQ